MGNSGGWDGGKGRHIFYCVCALPITAGEAIVLLGAINRVLRQSIKQGQGHALLSVTPSLLPDPYNTLKLCYAAGVGHRCLSVTPFVFPTEIEAQDFDSGWQAAGESRVFRLEFTTHLSMRLVQRWMFKGLFDKVVVKGDTRVIFRTWGYGSSNFADTEIPNKAHVKGKGKMGGKKKDWDMHKEYESGEERDREHRVAREGKARDLAQGPGKDNQTQMLKEIDQKKYAITGKMHMSVERDLSLANEETSNEAAQRLHGSGRDKERSLYNEWYRSGGKNKNIVYDAIEAGLHEKKCGNCWCRKVPCWYGGEHGMPARMAGRNVVERRERMMYIKDVQCWPWSKISPATLFDAPGSEGKYLRFGEKKGKGEGGAVHSFQRAEKDRVDVMARALEDASCKCRTKVLMDRRTVDKDVDVESRGKRGREGLRLNLLESRSRDQSQRWKDENRKEQEDAKCLKHSLMVAAKVCTASPALTQTQQQDAAKELRMNSCKDQQSFPEEKKQSDDRKTSRQNAAKELCMNSYSQVIHKNAEDANSKKKLLSADSSERLLFRKEYCILGSIMKAHRIEGLDTISLTELWDDLQRPQSC